MNVAVVVVFVSQMTHWLVAATGVG